MHYHIDNEWYYLYLSFRSRNITTALVPVDAVTDQDKIRSKWSIQPMNGKVKEKGIATETETELAEPGKPPTPTPAAIRLDPR